MALNVAPSPALESAGMNTCFLPDQYAIVWAWNGAGDIMSFDPITQSWTDYGKTTLPDGTVVGGYSMDINNNTNNPLVVYQVRGKLYTAPLDDPTNLTEVGGHNNPAFGSSYPCGAFRPGTEEYWIGIGSGSTVGIVDLLSGEATTLGTLKDARDGANLSAGPGDWFFDPAGNLFLMARDIRGATFNESTGTVLWSIDPNSLVATRVGNTDAPSSGTGAAWAAANTYLLSTSNRVYTYRPALDPAPGSTDAWTQETPNAPHSINDLGNQWVVPEPIPVVICIDKNKDDSVADGDIYTVRQDADDPTQIFFEKFEPTIPGTFGKCEATGNPFVTDPLMPSSDQKPTDKVWNVGCYDGGAVKWREDCEGGVEYLYPASGERTVVQPSGFIAAECGTVTRVTDTRPFCLLNGGQPVKTVYQQEEVSSGAIIWFDETGTIPEPAEKVPGECPATDEEAAVFEQVVCSGGETYVRRRTDNLADNGTGLLEAVTYEVLWFNGGGVFYTSGITPVTDPLAPVEPSFTIGDCVAAPLPCVDFVPLGNLWRLKGNPTPGTLVEWWADPNGPIAGNATGHGNVSDIFKNDGSTLTHINGAPDRSYIAPFFSVEGTNAGDFIGGVGASGASDTSGTDQGKLSAYFIVPNNGRLRDGGTRTGERGGLWLNQCCVGDLTLLEERTTDTTSEERGVFNGTRVPFGIHYAEAAISDLSAWWNLTLEISFDDSATYEPLKGFTSKPSYECIPVIKCKDTGDLRNAVDGSLVVVGEFDVWCEPECAKATVASGGGTAEIDEQALAAAIVAAQRNVSPLVMNFTNEGDVQILRDEAGNPYPAGTFGTLIAVEDIGTGFVRWSIDGSVPTTQSGPSFTTTGPYHIYNMHNVDLSLVRLDGSSANSDYSVAFEVYNS